MFRRLLYGMGSIARGRVTFCLIAVGAGICGVVLRCSSLGRSLWLDEAWAANAASAHSLAGIFYYDAWLNTCPPLFLLLVRIAVTVFGLSNTVLRLVPSAMGILAGLFMLLFALRILLRQYALLAFVLFVFSPTAVNYSRELKQYSAEAAATTAILLACAVYIEKASARRFWLLVATVTVGLLVGYGIAFLLPGIALMIWLCPVRGGISTKAGVYLSGRFARAFLFAAIAGGILIGEYCVFVIPNSPAILRAAWAGKNAHVQSFAILAASESYKFIGELPLNHRFQQQSIRLTVVGFTIIVGLALAWFRFRKGRRKWLEIQIVCLLPCLLIIICDWFSWYPFTERTSLFALPCLIALLISSLQLMSFLLLKRHRDQVRPFLDVMVLGAIIITLIAGRGQNYRLIDPVEDMDGAVSFLHAHVQPQDFLWVHASCSEAFKLYARMSNWRDAPARFGHTAWPCCARGIPASVIERSSEALVRNDFGNALPSNFAGRVWLLYTISVAGDPQTMQTILRERGCTETPTRPPAFIKIAVASFDCETRDATSSTVH